MTARQGVYAPLTLLLAVLWRFVVILNDCFGKRLPKAQRRQFAQPKDTLSSSSTRRESAPAKRRGHRIAQPLVF